jgi:hypothetical protein
MADVQQHFRRSNEETFTAYTALLNETLAEAVSEQKCIEAGAPSRWTRTQLTEGVIPELTELLHAAKLGEVHFKYGKMQRMLESAYLVLDSCDGLGDTPLGKKILELQTVYSRI